MTGEEMDALLDPALYIGRCPEQVSRYIEEISPLLAEASDGDADIQL